MAFPTTLYTHPVGFTNPVTLRTSAALPAAGAWDAAPTASACIPTNAMQLYFKYTRGGAAGAFNFKIEVSPDSAGTDWYQMALYDAGAIVAGADTTSVIQREDVTYTATGAAAEYFTYGPVMLHGGVERVRIAARETGNIAAPGTLEITGYLFL